MRVESTKSVLVVILVLLIPCLILGGTGFTIDYLRTHATDKDKDKAPANTDRDFLFSGYLYFYSGRDLLGTYKCENAKVNCDYAYETIDDDNYAIDYYDDNEINKFDLVGGRYAFITDTNLKSPDDPYYRNADIILYNVIDGKKIVNYKAVKNYTIGIENNRFIVQASNEKWGVVDLSGATPQVIIPYEYDFIGLINKINESKLVAKSFVVKKDNYWGIINEDQTMISEKLFDQIKCYNDEYIAIKSNNSYYLLNLQGTIQLASNGFKDIFFAGRYVALLEPNNLFYVYDMKIGREITLKYTVPNGYTYSATMTNSGLQLKIGETIYPYTAISD